MNIDQTVDVFRKWLHMDDADSLLATLGAVAANNLDGDPVWLLLVGPPGGGKSELLNSLADLPYTRSAGTITEAALLSGTPTKDVATSAKGGLLRDIGDFGIIIAKDFGSLLSMNRDGRAQVLAALREIYDGKWTRLVGTDGGRSLHWEGKVGFIGGVTPTIDRHHAVMGAMGERFMLYRLPDVDANLQARRALSHAGKEKRMRTEISEAVNNLLTTQRTHVQDLDNNETDHLIALTTLVVRARSSVERDNYTREIELVPGSEAPTRLAVALSLLRGGLEAIGLPKADAWRVLTKVGLDSIPALRADILRTLHDAGSQLSTNVVAGEVRHPATTTRRACEDLVAHGLVECHRQGDGQAHMWELTTFAAERMEKVLDWVPGPDTDPTRPDTDPAGTPLEVPPETAEKSSTDKTGNPPTDKTGKRTNPTVEPETGGFPEMSEHQGTVPETPDYHSYSDLPNQIHDITGTLASSTNRNNEREHDRPPIDESLAHHSTDPGTNGTNGTTNGTNGAPAPDDIDDWSSLAPRPRETP